MKNSLQTIIAHIFVATQIIDASCPYPNSDPSVLPLPVKATLKEIQVQQKSFKSKHEKVYSFVLETRSDQDLIDIKACIKIFLSLHNITLNYMDDEEDSDFFGIDLPGVSIESLPHGPFELAYFFENEFGLAAAEPDLIYPDAFALAEEKDNTGRSTLQRSLRPRDGGGGEDGQVQGDSCDDPDNKEWHLKHVKAPQAWAFSEQENKKSRGEGIVIAQIDTGYSDHYGIFTDHGIWENPSNKGFNEFRGEDPTNPKDKLESEIFDPGHGTVVAPHAIGRGDEDMKGRKGGKSPRGTAPKASLYSIRAVNNPFINIPDTTRIIASFNKIVEEDINVDVISMSIGALTLGARQHIVRDKIRKAIDKNIIVIAAGGQSFRHDFVPVSYPARFDQVIAVGGYQIADTAGDNSKLFHERKMEWWPDAHAGRKLDISAPAKDVCNAKVEKDPLLPPREWFQYKEVTGTSLSTAMTGGIAALWLAHHGKENLIQHFSNEGITLQIAFKQVLQLTANTNGWKGGKYERKFGHGMIDAEAILKLPLADITSAAAKSRRLGQPLKEDPAEEDDAGDEEMNFLLEIGYDEETLKPLQGTDDLQRFLPELAYMKSDDDEDAEMSSLLRAKLDVHP